MPKVMILEKLLIILLCNKTEKIKCRKRNTGGGCNFSYKLLLISACVIGSNCEPLRGIKGLQAALHEARVPPPFLGHCDFEQTCKAWTADYQIITPKDIRDGAPKTDASDTHNGHFLWLKGPKLGQLWSIRIPPTGAQCFLELATHQVQMHRGIIRLIIEINNVTSSVASERIGNNDAKWNITRLKLGAISQPYRIGLEIVVPKNGSIAIDNIRLDDCFPESKPLDIRNNCTPEMFRCNNGSCLNRTRICDLTADCADGEDEGLECEKIPEAARCNFEKGWCGWTNAPGSKLKWRLHRGSTPSEGTGPSYDHTYRNETGTYAFVNSSRSNDLGDHATLNSPIFNPTPPYSSDKKSPYFQSCQVRFFFHQYGTYSGSFGLYLIEMKPHQNQSQRLYWNYGDRNDIWYDQVVALPDIRYRYFLQFEASKGFAAKADVAIDDFSLSPECFGIGVPREVVGDFNYYNPVIESEHEMKQHSDFVNDTVIKITTCGATGRYGPAFNQCLRAYNGTELESEIINSSLNQTGIENTSENTTRNFQKWTVPHGGYYTIIAMGARGGRGSEGMGSTLGALARGVAELEKGQVLYFLVGQPGADACTKSLRKQNNPCSSLNSNDNESPTSGMSSLFREVKKVKVLHGGGGGGGGTFVFTQKESGDFQPLLIAGGGGGLGFGKFSDDGIQHGHGLYDEKNHLIGLPQIEKAGGAGGGWNSSSTNDPSLLSAGESLTKGGVGGKGCHVKNQTVGFGDGGFGGGGGGCRTGGGGGGYVGGTTGVKSSSNGEGGYSYASSDIIHIHFKPGFNPGPGEIYLIPAISGCGCDFRCVAVDRHLSETRCLCPPGWQLGNDSRSCLADELDNSHQTFMIILVAVCLSMFFAFSGLCLILYNRYQNRKALQERRQFMFGNGTELTTLQTVNDNMMTEFNPNYEFAGNLYSIKDLPQIPRDSITCVKPLGQGAFGEVFQGIYKYRRNEEAPIAVKTLPTVTTSQAAADFMMEALIMSKFDHPNIVKFIGISFDKNPRYIVLELLAGGDLKNFLREERPRPDRSTNLMMKDLVVCAHDVASGCKYMEDARFIHRDIAARNCLLTCKGPGRIVKIADFGMARDIYRSDYYRKGGKAMLPIKWMPPESFLDGIFSTKTDVWAFGVLLWEIMSFGYMPYTGCANREVMSMVTTGGRLEKPAGCPDPLYGIMARCWHPRPEDRPSFATIVERLGYCLQDPDVINHPMPNYDILPDCDREITIMRPDPEAECINVNTDLDGCGYMQPRSNFRPAAYRIGVVPGIVYASLRHCDNFEGETIQETTLVHPKELEAQSENTRCRVVSDNNSPKHFINLNHEENFKHQYSPNKASLENNEKQRMNNQDWNIINRINTMNSMERKNHENGNGESTTKENSESIPAVSSASPPETAVSSPNTRSSSPCYAVNINPSNVNGIMKKNALKAALSLDPSTLYHGTIPYEKVAFSSPPLSSSNPGSIEIKKESLGHELPREEECSC